MPDKKTFKGAHQAQAFGRTVTHETVVHIEPYFFEPKPGNFWGKCAACGHEVQFKEVKE